MAKKTINLGSGELTGDGESLRSALNKTNANFDELYAIAQDFNAINSSIVPDTSLAYDLGTAQKRFRDLYLSGNTIDLGGTTLSVVGGNLQVNGIDIKDVVISAGVDYSEIQNTPTALSDLTNDLDYASIVGNTIQNNGLPVIPTQNLDIKGSVFADDSTLLVDGVNGSIPQAVIPELNGAEVNIGFETGLLNNAGGTINIGFRAGYNNQAQDATAIGYLAGQRNQETLAIAIGGSAAYQDQGFRSVAIGYNTGYDNQGSAAVAIGSYAGRDNQGQYSIAIGTNAGYNNQHLKTIILNATGNVLDSDGEQRFYVKPVREAAGTYTLKYNPTNSEVTYEEITSFTGDVTGSVFADDSTLLVDGVNGVIPTSVLQGDISNDIKGSEIVIETTTSPGSITLTQTGIGNISLSGTAIDFNNSPIENFILSVLSSGLTAPGSAVVAGESQVDFNFSGVSTVASINSSGNLDINSIVASSGTLNIAGSDLLLESNTEIRLSSVNNPVTLTQDTGIEFADGTVQNTAFLGISTTPYTKFFLNTDAETKPPLSTISNSFYLGENWGTWFEVTHANASSVGTLAPGSAAYDPTLTGISFNGDRFQGFVQGGVYEMMIEIETQDSFGRSSEIEEYALETSTDAYANFTRYYPGNNQYQTLQYSGTFVFENSNTAANWVRIVLHDNMGINYYIPKATFTIKRIA